MDIDLAFISRLVIEESPELTGFNSDWLIGDKKSLFESLVKHRESYAKFPSAETLMQKAGVELMPVHEVTEPLAYYMDQLKVRTVNNAFADVLKSASKSIEDSNPEAGMELVKKGLLDLDERFRLRSDGMDDVSSEVSRAEVMQEYEDIAKLGTAGVTGIRTPWEALDMVTGGFNAGETIVIAARLGMGKTFGLCLLADCARRQGFKVLFVTKEMPRRQIRKRLHAIGARIPYGKFKTGRLEEPDLEKLKEYLSAEKNETPLFISHEAEVQNMFDVEVLVDKHKIDIVMIDGLYLLGAGSRDTEEMALLSGAAKSLALRKGIPLIFTHQLNRVTSSKIAGATDKNLGFSDAIGQDADWVFGLSQDKNMKMSYEMMWHSMKTRDGVPIEITMVWDLNTMSFAVLQVEGGVELDTGPTSTFYAEFGAGNSNKENKPKDEVEW